MSCHYYTNSGTSETIARNIIHLQSCEVPVLMVSLSESEDCAWGESHHTTETSPRLPSDWLHTLPSHSKHQSACIRQCLVSTKLLARRISVSGLMLLSVVNNVHRHFMLSPWPDHSPANTPWACSQSSCMMAAKSASQKYPVSHDCNLWRMRNITSYTFTFSLIVIFENDWLVRKQEIKPRMRQWTVTID